MNRPSISAIFPVRDAAPTVASLVVIADRTLRRLADDYEIVVVDAGSADHTVAVLRDLVIHYPRLRVLALPAGSGYGAALRHGLGQATKELLACAPGDAHYDPRDIARLLAALEPDRAAVDGYCAERPTRLAARAGRSIVRHLFGLRVRDVDADFRLLRREVLDRVRVEEDGDAVRLELTVKLHQAGYAVAETPVSYCPRADDRARLLEQAQETARLWWRLQWRGDYRRALAEHDAVEQILAGCEPTESSAPPGLRHAGGVARAAGSSGDRLLAAHRSTIAVAPER